MQNAGHGNKNARSDAGESDALIPTQGTNSPRGTRKGLDLPLERECPPDGTHSGLVSSLVSRWESDTRSQRSGQGMEPSLDAMMTSSELSRTGQWPKNPPAEPSGEDQGQA